jgi:glutathione S-transferase
MLYETQAILRYLDRVLTEPALTPADARAAARMDQAMNVNDWYLYQGVGNVIVFHRVVSPRLMGSAPDEAAIAAAMPKARVTFRELSRLLGTQSYFAGDAMSLADLMIAPQLDLFARAPEWAALTADAPNLVEWLERVTVRPSFEATTWERLVAIAEAA